MPFKCLYRLGSTTDLPDTVSNGGNRIEINTIQAVRNSSNKFLMKECFQREGIKTAEWFYWDEGDLLVRGNDNSDVVSSKDLPFPIVAKHVYGSRNSGNYLLKTLEELEKWVQHRRLDMYILESYKTYQREYRIHVTREGYFYTCRKMLKEDTAQDRRWFRNDSNSVWLIEENPLFDKPVNWDAVVAESVKALTAVGLDIGCVDLKIQSAKDKKGNLRENPEFIILETNSAPSMAEITTQKYLQEIPKVAQYKANLLTNKN